MKRLRLLGLILIFLFSFGIVFAQKKASGNSLNLTRIEQLVDKYISEKTNGTGGETALTGLSFITEACLICKKGQYASTL